MAENAESGPKRGLSAADFFIGPYVAASTFLVIGYTQVLEASRRSVAALPIPFPLPGLDDRIAGNIIYGYNPYESLLNPISALHATGTMLARHMSDIALIVEETHTALRENYFAAAATAYNSMLEASQAVADVTSAFADSGEVIAFPRLPPRRVRRQVYKRKAHLGDNVEPLPVAFER